MKSRAAIVWCLTAALSVSGCMYFTGPGSCNKYREAREIQEYSPVTNTTRTVKIYDETPEYGYCRNEGMLWLILAVAAGVGLKAIFGGSGGGGAAAAAPAADG